MIAGIALGGDGRSLAPGGGVEDVAFDRRGARAALCHDWRAGRRVGSNHSAAGSLEERGVEAPLQVRELMTQRGLREVQLLTGSREVPSSEMATTSRKSRISRRMRRIIARWAL